MLARETIVADLPKAGGQTRFPHSLGLEYDNRLGFEMGAGGWLFVRSYLGSFTPYRCCRKGRWHRAFWSGRLAQIPDAQVYDLKQASDHGGLAEHAETLAVVRKLVETGTMPKPAAVAAATAAMPAATLGTPKATQAKTSKWIADARLRQDQERRRPSQRSRSVAADFGGSSIMLKSSHLRVVAGLAILLLAGSCAHRVDVRPNTPVGSDVAQTLVLANDTATPLTVMPSLSASGKPPLVVQPNGQTRLDFTVRLEENVSAGHEREVVLVPEKAPHT